MEKCPLCGELMTFVASMCKKCSSEKSRKVKRPDKEQLFQLIQKYPFTKLAEYYGVTDNAIRKWCVCYGLPYKRKDIALLKTS